MRMLLKGLAATVAFIGISTAFAASSNNSITIYVAPSVGKCVSFNLVKIDAPTKVENTKICPGSDGGFSSLNEGSYKLYATEVGSLLINPYGDNEYITDPIVLTNSSGLAVYYPSRFKPVTANKIEYPTQFKKTNETRSYSW